MTKRQKRVGGTGRDPKCVVCRKDKEQSYIHGSFCRTCKLQKEKDRYAKKRAEAGKEARREGRNPICKCGKAKENQQMSFCRECNTEAAREYRAKQKLNPEYLQKKRERYYQRLEGSFNNRLKKNCREATHRAIKAGMLVKQPCEECQSVVNVQVHHDDYSKPLQVRWLCPWHHAEHHKNDN